MKTARHVFSALHLLHLLIAQVWLISGSSTPSSGPSTIRHLTRRTPSTGVVSLEPSKVRKRSPLEVGLVVGLPHSSLNHDLSTGVSTHTSTLSHGVDLLKQGSPHGPSSSTVAVTGDSLSSQSSTLVEHPVHLVGEHPATVGVLNHRAATKITKNSVTIQHSSPQSARQEQEITHVFPRQDETISHVITPLLSSSSVDVVSAGVALHQEVVLTPVVVVVHHSAPKLLHNNVFRSHIGGHGVGLHFGGHGAGHGFYAAS